jgi:type II secretory pathway pseudopilin PulG
MTLVETIVVVALLSGVLAMAQGTLILIQRQVTGDADRLDQSQRTKVAVESLTRNLRTAILPKQLSATCGGCDIAAFIRGDERSVEFYANVDNDQGTVVLDAGGRTTQGPRRVTYRVTAAGALEETVQRPLPHFPTDFDFQYCNPTVTGCSVQRRVLARGVSTAVPLFTYYANNGTTIPYPLESAESRLKAVDSIDLVLTVQAGQRAASTTVTTRVTLPNADSLPPTPSPTATP